MIGGNYEFSSVQVNLPNKMAHEIIQWGEENVKEEDIFEDPDDLTFGREDEIHVTILYGIHTKDLDEIKKALLPQKPFFIRLGRISIFENDKFDVIKIEVESKILRELNNRLKSTLTNSEPYPAYRPHITIAYTKKDKYKKLIGNMHFDNRRWKVKEVFLSTKEGKKKKIELTNE